MIKDKRQLEPKKKKYVRSLERDDWEMYGCSDNHDWHEHLNGLIWAEFTPKLV